jgi:hypothetical protein
VKPGFGDCSPQRAAGVRPFGTLHPPTCYPPQQELEVIERLQGSGGLGRTETLRFCSGGSGAHRDAQVFTGQPLVKAVISLGSVSAPYSTGDRYAGPNHAGERSSPSLPPQTHAWLWRSNKQEAPTRACGTDRSFSRRSAASHPRTEPNQKGGLSPGCCLKLNLVCNVPKAPAMSGAPSCSGASFLGHVAWQS